MEQFSSRANRSSLEVSRFGATTRDNSDSSVWLSIGSRDTGKTAVDSRTLFTCQFPGWIPEIPRALNARRTSTCQFILEDSFSVSLSLSFPFSLRSAPLTPLLSCLTYTHCTSLTAPNAVVFCASDGMFLLVAAAAQ